EAIKARTKRRSRNNLAVSFIGYDCCLPTRPARWSAPYDTWRPNSSAPSYWFAIEQQIGRWAGFIGSHLVDRLLAAGRPQHEPNYEIVAFANVRRGSGAHLERHVTTGSIRLSEGDIRDEAALQK